MTITTGNQATAQIHNHVITQASYKLIASQSANGSMYGNSASSQIWVNPSPQSWVLPSIATAGPLSSRGTIDDYSEPNCLWYYAWRDGFEDARKKRRIAKRYKPYIADGNDAGLAYQQGRKDGREYLKVARSLQSDG